jgi:hypothetical protein
MPQAVTIRSLARAFAVVKGMQAEGLEWGEDGAWRHRTCRTADAPVCADRGVAGLCAPASGDRPDDTGLLCAGAVDAQGRRGAAADPRPAGQSRHGQRCR